MQMQNTASAACFTKKQTHSTSMKANHAHWKHQTKPEQNGEHAKQ